MNEQYLTLTEIKAKYPREWVYLDRPTSGRESLAPTGGHVVYHSADHGEFLRRVFDFPEVTDGAIVFTGPPVLDAVEEVATACEPAR